MAQIFRRHQYPVGLEVTNVVGHHGSATAKVADRADVDPVGVDRVGVRIAANRRRDRRALPRPGSATRQGCFESNHREVDRKTRLTSEGRALPVRGVFKKLAGFLVRKAFYFRQQCRVLLRIDTAKLRRLYPSGHIGKRQSA